ncbi:hypothetical protein HHK36_013631 [Tetracentron sinense]|uniref:Subtilisin-like protease SBT1.5 n=1 Tax=Tetracentron sinense TaxID=13715 RepID=A0A834Z3N1_TETSI|nr:hypothetical protein HHK36_013631 [Tetracentron sinense]
MPSFLSLPLLVFFFSTSLQISQTSFAKETFIALLDPDSKPSPFVAHDHWYASLVSSSPFIHVYRNLIHGFSATLTSHEAQDIEKSHGVLAVFPDSALHLHTTRSPSFLALDRPNSLLSNLSYNGSETIIGIIDTGIWPESESFSDRDLDLDLGSVPIRWRGECEEGVGFNRSNCNRKLIGARFFSGGYEASLIRSNQSFNEFRSPRDSDGHGTHVASIAAGSPVAGAGFQGFAEGTSRGMAPRSRIAVYKVCWASGCLLSDVCAAFEKAVSDGVDIVSVSLGSSRLPFYLDLLSIVSFRASVHGVFVAESAGNEGPYGGSITNTPPWVTTVGAGTLDRDFPASVFLGNGKTVSGTSITVTDRHNQTRYSHPLYLADKITSSLFNFSRQSVKGRIVLCMTDRHVSRISLGASLKYAGAIAMIISHGEIDPNGIITEPHVIPTITVGNSEAKLIQDYIMSDQNPTAVIISHGTVPMHAKPAPIVASFSSRGPNPDAPRILKPDLIAPGVNILGAWTDAVGPSDSVSDDRRLGFNVMSGTSMACPHVSGVAALIKSGHPDWSPTEIKSALMTTSSTHKQYYHRNPLISDEFSGNAASPFDMGAGHLQPERAMDPGLVYDLGYQDYVNFLCGLNFTLKQIQIITGNREVCPENGGKQLNYPAIVVEEEEVEVRELVLVRRLKNVSERPGVYRAKVVGPGGYYKVNVEPKRLRFNGPGETLSFKVVIRKEGKRKKRWHLWAGALSWREIEGNHLVNCPIVVYSAKKYLVAV